MLARKRAHRMHIVRVDPVLLYSRLLDAPEIYSHLYFLMPQLVAQQAPCPPFDEPEWLDQLWVHPSTKLASFK